MVINNNREPLVITLDTDTSSVSISSGVMQIGQSILPMDGTRIPFQNMTGLYGYPGMYQNVTLIMKPYPTVIPTNIDMTCRGSDMTAILQTLTYPSAPDSSSRALGVFSFFNSDGTVGITSYSKVI